MKDIDFDELDRAVNSLMSPVDQPQADTPTTSPQPAPATAAPSVTAQPPVAPPATSTVQPPAAQEQPVSARPATPAARRTGRFMDMVSTSASKPTPSLSPPSREGLAISPRQLSVEPTAPIAPAAPVVSEPVLTQPAPSVPVTSTSMPDPLDMMAPAGQDDSSGTEESPLTETSPFNQDTAPIESPFLADAKVEKRPLNPGTMFDSPEASEPVLTEEPVGTGADEPSADIEKEMPEKKQDEPLVNPQVPELDSDLVAIESNEQVEVTQATETADAASKVEQPSVPLGAASIAQQYKTTPSTGDQSHAAIYDASQYPQPVAHPAKHRSSWWWVLWVVLLLGVGAGGAVLMYNLGIIP